MVNRGKVGVFVLIVGLPLAVLILHHTAFMAGTSLQIRTCADDSVTSRLLEQRNLLSRLLNMKQQQFSQLECERKKSTTSKTGGYCPSSARSHIVDTKLIPVLAEFLSGKHVGSFGDGDGKYKQLIEDSGKVKGYDAYDGAPFSNVTTEGRVQYLDLTLPQYGLPLYDWIISLEVAEHIPQPHEAIYIDNVVRHAREGVVLSWAVPGQDGNSHVNCRTFEYVKTLMKGLDFIHDALSSAMLKNASDIWWIKQNINVYRRTNSYAMKTINFET